MKITKQARRDAKQLFTICCSHGLLDEGKVRQAVQLVIAQKPRGYVAILARFHRLAKLDIEGRTARVESAVPLSGEQEAAVRNNLTQRYGPGLSIAYGLSPALLGGLRIKVGSDVYDGSVHARLAALQESF